MVSPVQSPQMAGDVKDLGQDPRGAATIQRREYTDSHELMACHNEKQFNSNVQLLTMIKKLSTRLQNRAQEHTPILALFTTIWEAPLYSHFSQNWVGLKSKCNWIPCPSSYHPKTFKNFMGKNYSSSSCTCPRWNGGRGINRNNIYFRKNSHKGNISYSSFYCENECQHWHSLN